MKTTAGAVTLKRPKLRRTTEQFASRLLGKVVTRTNALESLVIAGFIRGLSVRDVEAALAEALGPEATVFGRVRSNPSPVIRPGEARPASAVLETTSGQRRARNSPFRILVQRATSMSGP